MAEEKKPETTPETPKPTPPAPMSQPVLPVTERAATLEIGSLMDLVKKQDERIKALEAKASSIEGLMNAVKPQISQALMGGNLFETVFKSISGLKAPKAPKTEKK
jgi:hypothetical protein